MMEAQTLERPDGHTMHYYRWLPGETPRAVVQIAHGMGEHAARYDWTAAALTGAGYAVYAQDHRGHGRSATPETYGDMGADGWNRTIADAAALTDALRSAHPDVPLVLLGHSMGAMLAQQYAYRFGDRLDALVLSGSPGFGGAFQLWLSHTIARFESWRLGFDAHSELLQNLLFGKSNEPFDGPDATGFEWLSRDPEQVRRYVDDPACGFVLRSGSVANLMAGAREARKRRSVGGIPSGLSVYVFSGSADPVHGEEKGLERLLRAYRKQLESVDYRLYPEGRHEMLNETNRDQVVQDLIGWLRQALP
ncbi:MAG: alpha/beta hydrolase [Pseudomonadales bacterium]|jgi:alpha-beta hydrolase superfamily lysophospholipase